LNLRVDTPVVGEVSLDLIGESNSSRGITSEAAADLRVTRRVDRLHLLRFRRVRGRVSMPARLSRTHTANHTLARRYHPTVARLRETHERELKLAVPPGFRLPEIAGEPLEPRTFTSTYHDSADRALTRAGITLRRRVQNRRGLWQLKLPGEGERLELEAPGGPAEPPAELAALLLGVLRGRALEPAAVLRTYRKGVCARENGRAVAEVTIDTVTVLDGRRVRERFVELEVEALDDEGAASLPRLEQVLLDAGATVGEGRPKAFRAMGHFPSEPRVPPRWAPPLEHVRAMLAEQVAELIAHDPGTRLGEDPEELHQTRVATRRLRAVLRAARPLLDETWAESLRTELSWLGGALGPVRDLDVLLERLREEIDGLEPAERDAAAPFLEQLEEERASARAAMLEAMSSQRYAELLTRLEVAAVAPRARAAEISLEAIAAREFRKLRKAVRSLPSDPSDDELHAVRIRGKRARYAAELAEGVAGKPARRVVQDAKRLQDVIGEHQDAVVAEERIRGLLDEAAGPRAHFAAGRLVERERERRRRARAEFPEAWSRLEKSGKRAWR
jgi:CHAD domain-containing protein